MTTDFLVGVDQGVHPRHQQRYVFNGPHWGSTGEQIKDWTGEEETLAAWLQIQAYVSRRKEKFLLIACYFTARQEVRSPAGSNGGPSPAGGSAES